MGFSRVAQLASSCVRSIRNLRVTFNDPNGLNLGSSVHSKFLVPAAPSFCEARPPTTPDGTEVIRRLRVPFAEAAEMVMRSEITHSGSCVVLLKAARLRSELLR